MVFDKKIILGYFRFILRFNIILKLICGFGSREGAFFFYDVYDCQSVLKVFQYYVKFLIKFIVFIGGFLIYKDEFLIQMNFSQYLEI